MKQITTRVEEALKEYLKWADENDEIEVYNRLSDLIFDMEDGNNFLLAQSEALEFFKLDAIQIRKEAKEMVKNFDDYPEKVKEIWLHGVDFACTGFELREEF